MSLLSVHGLKVAYGGIQAVRGIDIEVAEGELVCLIGANGAGKSSTLKGIMGLAHPRGEVLLAGERLHKLPTHAIAARGLALVPEGRGVFGRLTVAENLDMGAYARRDRAGIQADLARAYDLFPRLAERRAQLAGTLSGGEQQMLAIARALMGRPRLLLLDEPSMGLAPLMVRKIYETIAMIAAEGVTLLLVEQNAHLALKVSQRAYVMESGEITLSGASAELAANPRVRAAYLGE
ncbi:MAG: branched-chain amino acid transport system ATP-binding protein [bacterium]|nr:MAG: branched-chain amino acid transport system ATP-binding protein [bacterium]KAF0149305.1 MAG: branched-chain amino acid transport system ATP-binding protein [bacterium]KAF0169827.1 MAG: branched-chain amino acid transport system ATP-binding protein [bacterium]TXT22751.1 MAG: branched-chain amino acid transport system ATP-binding protein [bacterium]